MRSVASTMAPGIEDYGPGNPDARPGFYYVSAIDGARRSLVRGPFRTHAEALGAVEPTKRLVEERDPRAHWYAWGTARSEADLGPGVLDRWEAERVGEAPAPKPARGSRAKRAAPKAVKKRAATEASQALALAELRAQAIMDATERALEAALRRPAWREFEYEWFLRRLHEARVSLERAPVDARLTFVDRLRTTARVLREGAADGFETSVAAALMLDALTALFDVLEGREGRALTTSEEVYAAAERMRQAGGFPYWNRSTRTVDRLPKAKAIRGSVWVVHQKPWGSGREWTLSHGPSGTEVTLPRSPKAKIEAIARALAAELPDFARDAPLIHEIEGGPLGTRLVGGIPTDRLRELYAARDRALANAGVSWGGRT